MPVFDHYSVYYDLLYRDKDYPAETDFIVEQLKRYAPDAKSVLELGCGTGIHAVMLAEKGYDVHGIDFSAEMLAAADARLATQPEALRSKLGFAQGDVRTYRAGTRFDAVLSLFHVMSYQNSDEDLLAALATAAEHLEPGGVFLFDYWFGPAVLAQRPATRVKRMSNEAINVTRIAEPGLDTVLSVCDVNYTVFVEETASRAISTFKETHRMRYMFLTELRALASQVGLRMVDSFEWLTGGTPNDETWSVCSILTR